jgi:hypothetical protein
MSDHRLDTGVRSLIEAKDISSSFCVQTTSETHPASYPMGTCGPFSEGKARPGRDADPSPPSKTEEELCTRISSTPCRLHGGSGTALEYSEMTFS